MSSGTAAHASSSKEDVVDKLSQCPVCFDNPMVPPLWTVCHDNRHVICNSCFHKLKNDPDKPSPQHCPQCRETFVQSPMRNRMRPARLVTRASRARHALPFALTHSIRTYGRTFGRSSCRQAWRIRVPAWMRCHSLVFGMAGAYPRLPEDAHCVPVLAERPFAGCGQIQQRNMHLQWLTR